MPAQSPPTQDQIQQELNRVLAGRQFADSPRLSRFLSFVVEMSLAHETDQVKEYSIGLAVFDRPPDFDPRLDTIVRVQASKLRSRLNDYYGTEGASNPVKIQLPRGSYVPAFEYRDAAAPGTGAPVGSSHSARLRFWGAATIAVAAAFAAGFISAVRLRPPPLRADPIRFQVQAPAGCRFVRSPQVSPDGRKLVSVVLRKPGDELAIYLHSLETGAGAVLPGTIGGGAPYWSPVGRSIVFTKDSRLYRLDLGAGAEPVLVAPVESIFGIDWNRNGVFLIAGNPGPIRRLSLSGGGLTALTAVDKPQVAHLYPRFLPDGNHFLYLARNETPGDSAIYVASLDGRVKKRILRTETKALFVPTSDSPTTKGHILFVRAGELLAQPFDLIRLEVTGAPRPVAGGIPQSPYGASPFSASSGILAYATEAGAAGQLTWFDRTGNTVGELGPVAALGDPVISPDGGRVAYDKADGSNRDIWTVEINSGKTTRITFDPEVDHAPAWSPDSSRIAFESHRTPPGIYVTASQGGAAESLLLAGGDGFLDWASDDSFLLFDSMWSELAPNSIWLLPLRGERKPRLWLRSAGNVRRPVLSPNGKWIAYVSSESGRNDVYVQPFDAGSAPGTGKWQVSVGGGSQPAWRADGRELFYLSPGNVLMAATVTPGTTFNYERPIPLFDTRLRVLRGPRNDYATRDGNRFLFRVPAQAGPDPPLHVVVNWPAAFGN